MAASIAFPLRFAGNGRTAMAVDAEHVRDLIEQVLFTSPGERVNRPRFGAGLLQLPFEPAGDQLQQTIEFLVRGALSEALGRIIDVQSIGIERTDATLAVDVRYVLRGTGEAQQASFERPA